MLRLLRQIFLREDSIRRASGILIITLTLSNILGLLRDHFLTQKIPTSELDIYYAAFRLPDLIFNIFVLGAISAAFIPVFTRYIDEKKKKEAWHVAASLINLGLVLVGGSLVILYFLMPSFIPYLVPKFDPQKQETTVRLARLMLLSPVFFTFSYFLSGILNSFRRFLVYSIAPLIYNLAIILATLLFVPRLGVIGAVYGVILGAFLHFLVQLPSAVALGFRPRWAFNFLHPGVRQVFRLMVPRAIGLGGQQIMLLAFTAIASAMPGAVAIYNLADNIQTVPTVIFATSFATAVFPTLARYTPTNKETQENFFFYLRKTAATIIFFILGASVLMLVLRAQIVRLILGSGYFGWEDTRATTDALTFFLVSLVAQGLIPLLARAFYALHDTKTPMVISLLTIAASIGLAFYLHLALGEGWRVQHLALSFSVGAWLNMLLLFVFLSEKIKIRFDGFFRELFLMIVWAFFAAAIAQGVKRLFALYFDINFVINLFTQTLLAGGIGVILYLLGGWLCKLTPFKNEK